MKSSQQSEGSDLVAVAAATMMRLSRLESCHTAHRDLAGLQWRVYWLSHNSFRPGIEPNPDEFLYKPPFRVRSDVKVSNPALAFYDVALSPPKL